SRAAPSSRRSSPARSTRTVTRATRKCYWRRSGRSVSATERSTSMRNTVGRVISMAALFALLSACGDNGEDVPSTPAWDVREAVLVPPWQEGCESDHVPLVMVHGFLASGDTYANHVM